MNETTKSEMHKVETIKNKSLMNTLKKNHNKVNKSTNLKNNIIQLDDNKK